MLSKKAARAALLTAAMALMAEASSATEAKKYESFTQTSFQIAADGSLEKRLMDDSQRFLSEPEHADLQASHYSHRSHSSHSSHSSHYSHYSRSR